jgi:hypothetical protein
MPVWSPIVIWEHPCQTPMLVVRTRGSVTERGLTDKRFA